ncbi:MAG: hypothetical protein FJX60_21765 [Alphaproteobacteria bacterium]|nr:hypothetical protein [Alphaproteobacteria bacterium]
MSGEAMLTHAAGIVAERRKAYGHPSGSMEILARRWSITLGHPVTPAQAVMCLIDLKLTRLSHDPRHDDSIRDLAGYAAVLHEVTR